jgi:hypothetical protein
VPFVERVRPIAFDSRSHPNDRLAGRLRPFLGGGHERASHTGTTRPIVNDEAADLGACVVLDQEPTRDVEPPDDAVVADRDEHRVTGITSETRPPDGNPVSRGGISELAAKAGHSLDVGRLHPPNLDRFACRVHSSAGSFSRLPGVGYQLRAEAKTEACPR